VEKMKHSCYLTVDWIKDKTNFYIEFIEAAFIELKV